MSFWPNWKHLFATKTTFVKQCFGVWSDIKNCDFKGSWKTRISNDKQKCEKFHKLESSKDSLRWLNMFREQILQKVAWQILQLTAIYCFQTTQKSCGLKEDC